MFDAVNNGSVANHKSLFYPANYNYSSQQSSGNGSGLTSTNNPLLTSYSGPASPSIYSNASSSTTTRSANKKQSKNGGNTSGAGGDGGFQDQNAIRRGFNGTENYNNGFGGGGGGSSGRNKEGRQKNNRKQISSGGGAVQNSDEGAEWSYDSGNYSEPKYYLGKLIQGTYCSRVFSDCERRACRMQSPNYPGVYPRNLTCFYAVRQVSVVVV